MGDIYANTYATILASSAAGDTEGFLRKRPQPHLGTTVESVEGSGKLDINVQRVMFHETSSTPGGKPELLEGPLADRAWAFQEGILSQRTISYHHDEIVWECSSRRNCECGKVYWGPSGVLNWPTQGKIVSVNYARRTQVYLKPLTQDNDARALYEEWKILVLKFTRRKLTKSLDRLPGAFGNCSKPPGQDSRCIPCGHLEE